MTLQPLSLFFLLSFVAKPETIVLESMRACARVGNSGEQIFSPVYNVLIKTFVPS